jgi:hypothetical protein
MPPVVAMEMILCSAPQNNDQAFGELGNDTVRGGDDPDQVNGGEGADQVFGGQLNDALTGGPGTIDVTEEPEPIVQPRARPGSVLRKRAVV